MVIQLVTSKKDDWQLNFAFSHNQQKLMVVNNNWQLDYVSSCNQHKLMVIFFALLGSHN